MKTAEIAALQELEKRNGTLIPEDLVEAARAIGHPFHNRFDWSNQVAADNWRLHQARNIIGEYRIVVTVSRNSYSVSASAYVRDPKAGREVNRYKSITAIEKRSAEAKAALLPEARRCLSVLEGLIGHAKVWGIPAEGLGTARAELIQFVNILEPEYAS